MNVTATLFGQMITFIVFVWFIKAYLWEPLTQAMESRTKKISDGLAAAEQGQKKIEQATIEFTTRIDQAKTEASSIITDAELHILDRMLRQRIKSHQSQNPYRCGVTIL